MYKQNKLSHLITQMMEAENTHTIDKETANRKAEYKLRQTKHINDSMIKLCKSCTF